MSVAGGDAHAMAELALSYDRIPYDSQPFAEARPAYLAGLGVLHGLSAALPSSCRVLELGCASGGHLIPLAWYHPGAHFVGVDLSAGQIETGSKLVKALRLRNCELHAGDLNALRIEPGSFDYVIAHGLYSWVPAAVRGQLLALCRRALAPGGIAYVSYNTLPGWRTRGLMRDLLGWHLRTVEGPQRRLNAAWTLLQKLAHAGHAESPNSYLEMEVQRILARPPSYLAHEFLEPQNHAVTLHEFVDRAAAAGLRYLCNTDLMAGNPDSYDRIGAVIEDLCDDPVSREQYLDFVTNRAFRQSLLCRDDAPPTAMDRARITRLYLVADLAPPPQLDLQRSSRQVFHAADGTEQEIRHPLSKAALALLHEAYPHGMRYADLLDGAAQQVRLCGDPGAAGEADAARKELFDLVVLQHVEALPESPTGGISSAGAYPSVGALAREQAAQGWTHLATCTHRALDIDDFARALIMRLDGYAQHSALPALMLDWLATHRQTDASALRRLQPKVEMNVQRLLELFARHGVLADA